MISNVQTLIAVRDFVLLQFLTHSITILGNYQRLHHIAQTNKVYCIEKTVHWLSNNSSKKCLENKFVRN